MDVFTSVNVDELLLPYPLGALRHEQVGQQQQQQQQHQYDQEQRTQDGRVPKPQLSYIGLIAIAILSSPERKMVLSDVYQWIVDNYPYFRTRGPGWRNSIRHNLSLNDCFVKAGRSANGKGHYWAIHPANIEDFMRCDFRRKRAQQKVRRHMGLSINEDELSDDSPVASPLPAKKSFSVESILRPDFRTPAPFTKFPTCFAQPLQNNYFGGYSQ